MTESQVIEKKTGIYWLWLTLFVIVVDQVSKYFVIHALQLNQVVNVLPFLNFILEHNKGAAFSFLSDAGSLAIWLFIGTAFLISLILGIWLHRLPSSNVWLGASLALILGGAIGNLIDRILYGYVIDFIHFHIHNWSPFIFNLADAAITIGSIMLIVDIFKKK